jgi:hypothetical protein
MVNKRKFQNWIAIILIIIPVLIAVGFISVWRIYARWPGSFLYTETRVFSNSQEEALLFAVETFDYSLIPVSETVFLSNSTLDDYLWQNATFNPILNAGSTRVLYFGNITHFATLDVIVNSTSFESPPYQPLLFESNGTLVFHRYPHMEWMGGYLNGSNYQGYEWNDDSGFTGTPFVMLNYTDVYLVEMKLTVSQTGAGSQGFFGDAYYEYQDIVVNSSGQILFVSWFSLSLIFI